MKVKIFNKSIGEFNDIIVSSDLHLNHEMLLKYRPFKSVEEMNESIISRINGMCGQQDLLLLLGDTMMGDKDYQGFFDRLICKNIIILHGNHTNRNRLNECETLFTGDYVELLIDKKFVVCSHYPIIQWNGREKGSYHLFGHLHGDTPGIVKELVKERCMDVGLDTNLLFPYTWDEIDRKLSKKEIGKIERHE